jgi:hypothetical protein
MYMFYLGQSSGRGWRDYLQEGWVLGKGMGTQHFYEVLLLASTLYYSEMANAI